MFHRHRNCTIRFVIQGYNRLGKTVHGVLAEVINLEYLNSRQTEGQSPRRQARLRLESTADDCRCRRIMERYFEIPGRANPVVAEFSMVGAIAGHDARRKRLHLRDG